MPEYLSPGVYVEETSFRTKAIEGVDTATAAFVGPTRDGPVATPTLVTSEADFARNFGDALPLSGPGASASVPNHMAHAVRAYFGNGGRRLWTVRTAADAAAYRDGLAALAAVDGIGTVATPGASAAAEADAIRTALVAFAERPDGGWFAVLDSAPGQTLTQVRQLRARVDSRHAALYYPWVVVADPAAPGGSLALPPSGFIAGLYARNDQTAGVHKAPADLLVAGALRFQSDLDTADQELLNPMGINCLRALPGRGLRVWGGRLASSDPAWKYLAQRRYMNYLEASLRRGTAWAVFEPQGERLWSNIRQVAGDFLHAAWRGGALLGTRPEEAYFVRCDPSTMTQDDLDSGRLVMLVGVALVRPAEFIIFRIGQWTANADVNAAPPAP